MSRNHNRHKQNIVEERQHVVFDEVEVPKINEPRPVCCICSEPIESIIEAICEGEDKFSHFDCVIKTLTEKYNVQEPDKISYIGCGNFAVVSMDEEGKYFIKEKISYESNEAYSNMKKFVDSTKH